jgi:hypothetical protein
MPSVPRVKFASVALAGLLACIAMSVLLTDREETCGGNPCTLGKRLHAEANQLTVHVIGIRVKG